MKRNLSLFLLLTLTFVTVSFNYPYKRLSKLYGTDNDKCLDVANRLSKYFPNNAAPYYFAMSVHFDKAQEETVARKKYNQMTKALSFARKFDKLNDEDFEAKVNWDDKANSMTVFTQKVIDELKEEKLGQLGKQLASKRRRLKWDKIKRKKIENDNDNDNVAEVETIEKIEAVPISNRVSGQYYGLALGTEIVPSHNLESEKEMLRLINIDRKKKGMGPLVMDENLSKAARYHAYDMGTQEYFSHESQDRKGKKLIRAGGTFERIRKFYSASFVNSENIAAGNESAASTYKQWYYSKGHYDNMFNSSSVKVGIGVVYTPDSPFGYYWAFCTAL